MLMPLLHDVPPGCGSPAKVGADAEEGHVSCVNSVECEPLGCAGRDRNLCTWVQIPSPPRAIGAVGARFPDTEEVTGSNPVSPTKKALVSDLFSSLGAGLTPGSVDLSAKLCRPIPRERPSRLVDGAHSVCHDWAQFLPVHVLGDACPSMAE